MSSLYLLIGSVGWQGLEEHNNYAVDFIKATK